MAKKIKITENTVLTHDDKGNLSLVGHAKEALTSFDKMKISVTILLDETSEEKAAAFLKDNNVPYAALLTMPKPDKKEDFDLCVIGGRNVIHLDDEWRWTASSVVRRLFEKPQQDKVPTEQEVFDKELQNIKKFAQERSKKSQAEGVLYPG